MAPESEVVSISEALDRNNHAYQKVTLADNPTRSYPVFDRKLLEGITPGVRVFYEAAKNPRGFLNLTELRPLGDKLRSAQPQENGQPAEAGAAVERAPRSEREQAMFSMNALNNAVALMVGFKERLEIKNIDDLAGKITFMHRLLLGLHESENEHRSSKS